MRPRWPAALLCTLLMVVPAWVMPSHAQVIDYDCSGELRTENVFEPDGAKRHTHRFVITASDQAGYVRRDPALATGCFAPRIEVCACDLGRERIQCRSLGLQDDGIEIGLDFSIDRQHRTLHIQGRRFDARKGVLIETRGEFICTEHRRNALDPAD